MLPEIKVRRTYFLVHVLGNMKARVNQDMGRERRLCFNQRCSSPAGQPPVERVQGLRPHSVRSGESHEVGEAYASLTVCYGALGNIYDIQCVIHLSNAIISFPMPIFAPYMLLGCA